MKRRVLHVIGNLGLGGAQSVLYHLWPSLTASPDYEFELCVLNSLGHFGTQLVSEGSTVHRLASKRKYAPKAVWELRKLIQQGTYQIVHAHLFPELPIVSMATTGLKKVMTVYTEHSANNRRRSLGSLSRAFDRMAYGSYARVVAVNNSAHSNLTTWLPETRRKSVMIPNSVRVFKHTAPTVTEKREMLNELGLSAVSTPNLILFAGRLTHVKGADLLLSALAQLKRCDYFCLIAGDGPEREMLEATAASLGLSDKIKFLGARKDVTNLLGLADFLVMPSRWEGLPLIMLEAMAAGCPIVGTSVDGTAEVLRNEVTALLAPAEDVNALAHCIERLIESPELRHSLSSKASLAVLDYSAEKIAPQLLGLYDELLQGAGTEVLGKLQ